MSGIADDVLSSNSRTLAPTAVGSQVAIMSIVSIATVVAFNLLRPRNKIVYEPKVKYHIGNKPPPKISTSLFGWLPPLVNTKEPELLDKVGLDAVAFLRFLRMLRWIFLGISFFTCIILLPVNIVYNLRHVDKNNRDILSMLTIRDVQGSFLFAHVVVSYVITFLVIFCVDYHWKKMVQLRLQWFNSPEYLESFYARTLQVVHVDKKYQSDEGLKAIFETVKVPYPTTSVQIGRKVGDLPSMIEFHNRNVREFEGVLVKYLKEGKLKAKRPTIRIGGKIGCGGVKKDAIEYYTAKLKRTEAAIEAYRGQIETRKPENYGFASMGAVPYAHIVGKMLAGKHPKGTTIELAPNPKDIIWDNMNKSDIEIFRNKVIGLLWLALVCFFNTVPLSLISVLANLDSLRTYVPFLQSWFHSSEVSFAIVSGVLPPAISGFFGFFLPIIMRWLTRFMGALTHSKLDRVVIGRYFAFLVVSQLVIFTLLGVIFNSVKQIIEQIGQNASFSDIIKNLHTLPDTINSTYINQSSYWLTFFPLRGFLVVFDLAQIFNLLWISFKTHVFGRTPRDIREWTQPPVFQYAIYYSNILFMVSVGLVFAPLAPLVVVAATIVFWMSSWVYKYQLMFVFITQVESGGRLWNVVVNRLLFCVILMQALMILTIGLQYKFSSLQWISTVPPVLFIIAYKIYVNRKYCPAFQYYIPNADELARAKIYSERADAKRNRLEKRFGHPALHTDLFTPMLHSNMMPLLAQIYQGRIQNDKAKMEEYGGLDMAAQIVPGGIKIAAISQSDLEYDPALYQRDRGELDWDQRSIGSTAVLDDASTLVGHGRHKVHDYIKHGPRHIELSRLDTQPLMAYQQPFSSTQSLLSGQDQRDNGPPIFNEPQDRSYSPTPAYRSMLSSHDHSRTFSPEPYIPNTTPDPYRRSQSRTSDIFANAGSYRTAGLDSNKPVSDPSRTPETTTRSDSPVQSRPMRMQASTAELFTHISNSSRTQAQTTTHMRSESLSPNIVSDHLRQANGSNQNFAGRGTYGSKF